LPTNIGSGNGIDSAENPPVFGTLARRVKIAQKILLKNELSAILIERGSLLVVFLSVSFTTWVFQQNRYCRSEPDAFAKGAKNPVKSSTESQQNSFIASRDLR